MPNDRDVLRPKPTPPSVAAQSAAPVEQVSDEYTDKYSGEQLREMRRSRDTGERLDRLEDKHDALVEAVTSTRVDVGQMKGTLKGQDRMLEEILSRLENKQLEHTTMRVAEIDISRERAKANILDEADAKKIERLDKLDARKAKRAFWLKIAGLVLSGGVLTEVLRLLFG